METFWIFKSDPKPCLIYSILSQFNNRWQFDPACSILLTFYTQRHRKARNGFEMIVELVSQMGAGPT